MFPPPNYMGIGVHKKFSVQLQRGCRGGGGSGVQLEKGGRGGAGVGAMS